MKSYIHARLSMWPTKNISANTTHRDGVMQRVARLARNRSVGVGSNLVKDFRFFLVQEMLHCLLSTGWSQERFERDFTIELNISEGLMEALMSNKPTC